MSKIPEKEVRYCPPKQRCIQVPVHYIPPCGCPPRVTGQLYISVPNIIPNCPPPCCPNLPPPEIKFEECCCNLPKPTTIIPYCNCSNCCKQCCSRQDCICNK
ncbi:hypothetical protein HELRODRAFT_182268 [Helobdella robusta]|uniref:Uncharacterized protein n=1 Tax=Helobdella robusta TaxID=6412 RepID=T1FI06_HELRO|nr:hypothetical protein HELRODRAFT_182268 [Helobdella robusta]ESN91112.1 hypothetical protein HELRODRAFT_182268 [Helobdella robusta]